MVDFVAGNLLNAEEDYLAQGVAEGNQEGLGTGVAFKISQRWPDVQSDFKKYARAGRFKGGGIWVAEPTEDRPGFVYLATQPDMYHATLSYLRKALRNLNRWAMQKNSISVGMPKIGSGLGKLSWESDVKPLMREMLTADNCRFVVYEDYKQSELG